MPSVGSAARTAVGTALWGIFKSRANATRSRRRRASSGARSCAAYAKTGSARILYWVSLDVAETGAADIWSTRARHFLSGAVQHATPAEGPTTAPR